MPFCQYHGRVKTDDGKHSGDLQNLLNNPFAYLCTEKVQLGGIVPWHDSTVVAMIDVASISGQVINPLEGYCCVGTVPVAIFKVDAEAGVTAEVRPVIGIVIIRCARGGKKPVRMVSNKFGIHSGMIGYHVTCKTDAALLRSLLQVKISFIAADVVGNGIIFKSVCRGLCFRISLELLDFLRGIASLPEPDQPQCRKAAFGDEIKLRIGNILQTINRASVKFTELVEPDIGAFGQHDHFRHPR